MTNDHELILEEMFALGLVIEDMFDTARVVTLLSGTKDDDTEFWAYVAIEQEKFEDYLKIRDQGHFDLNEWGDILMHGSGPTPNTKNKKDLFDTYGIDADALETVEKEFSQ